MNSLNDLIVRAENVGHYAASLAPMNSLSLPEDDPTVSSGENLGTLAVAAYRIYGIQEMKAVIRGYQFGYNKNAQERGNLNIRWTQIREHLYWAIPGATETETRIFDEVMEL